MIEARPPRPQRWAEPGTFARRLDWGLILPVLALGVISALLVYSATRAGHRADPEAFLKKHVLNLVIGAGLYALVASFDYRLLRAYAPVLYGLSIIGLVAVLTPLGDTVNGSHSWIVIGGGFQVQPSEFAKVGLVVLLAMILGEPRDGEVGPGTRDILISLALAGAPAALIMLQPDLGTTMVLCVVVIGMLALSGASKIWTVGLVAAGVALAVGAVVAGVLKEYQIARFTAFVDPTADPRGAGYNAAQAKIAVGSGGMFGKGLFNGEQTTGQFVPEQQTDFIFTVAGEELGYVGALVILGLIGIILFRGLRIAVHAHDPFGTLVASGVVCWLGFQTFENIGMCIGIMPITGLPLPFVSYGGSATFATMIALGLLQGVHMRGRGA
ncbi:rod shape-determining protein RodA [Actinocorallia sp. API 0066]|uniref:rod shape-determining protein RodA n=1 Tax=Actinocorallia sp. API 0066 TaxID=2896846 RepID=UPI001E634C57|nr:rod shape-determining protein RodA [Actinocorallia sp. API 0066]MCD0452868.1 rod shape-determining protein RodA [Actinocorallia sp. API 0066]